MLTKNQQVRLISMTSHSKYGQLLADAIEGWKIYDARQHSFGVDINSKNKKYECPDSCCLLGSSLINKKHNISYFKDLENIYKISEIDLQALAEGFDNTIKYFGTEAYMFGNKVAKILGLIQ